MRRKKAIRRGHTLSILAAAGVGYLLGSWSASAVRGAPSPSPAEEVALRFPHELSAPAAHQLADAMRAATAAAAQAGDLKAALFDPTPMVASHAAAAATVAAAQPARPAPIEAQPPAVTPPSQPVESALRFAEVEPTEGPQTPVAAVTRPLPPTHRAADLGSKPAEPATASKPRAAVAARHSGRDGVMLDEAQIVEIKHHLHLTPDQERMWPAVATALRNIGFARQREARRHGAAASVDPNSTEVQDLKYAAIPLLMSFNDEQKDEVRNLAHGMGLDQLASQF